MPWFIALLLKIHFIAEFTSISVRWIERFPIFEIKSCITQDSLKRAKFDDEMHLLDHPGFVLISSYYLTILFLPDIIKSRSNAFFLQKISRL